MSDTVPTLMPRANTFALFSAPETAVTDVLVAVAGLSKYALDFASFFSFVTTLGDEIFSSLTTFVAAFSVGFFAAESFWVLYPEEEKGEMIRTFSLMHATALD